MSYKPKRGDYGTHYAYDLVEKIEQWNCIKGCTRAGPAEKVAEFGPGGTCDLLAWVGMDFEITEFDSLPDRIDCTARTTAGEGA